MKKYILLILFMTSLHYNWFYGAGNIPTEPVEVTGKKATPGFQFILEPEGKNQTERERNFDKLFTTFSVGTENGFGLIKFYNSFARLWIIILVFCAFQLCYRLVMRHSKSKDTKENSSHEGR